MLGRGDFIFWIVAGARVVVRLVSELMMLADVKCLEANFSRVLVVWCIDDMGRTIGMYVARDC
ncbi:MAG: hypothetical protein COA73_09035 [Candidatus Hydrogenedentota bacterium]|nr:MAG: hypothetical protein COA73_09035 [Candidatus Hydrogenedentota bacterium]